MTTRSFFWMRKRWGLEPPALAIGWPARVSWFRTAYRVEGLSREQLMDVVEAACAVQGLSCQRTATPADQALICRQAQAWHRILTKRLPQRVRWWIPSDDHPRSLMVAAERFGWYRAWLWLLGIAGLLACHLCLSGFAATAHGAEVHPVEMLILVGLCACLPLYLAGALIRTGSGVIMEDVKREASLLGGTVTIHLCGQHSLVVWYGLCAVAYMLALGTVHLGPALSTRIHGRETGPLILVGTLLVLAAAYLLLLRASLQREGAVGRLAALMPSMGSSFCLIALAFTQLPVLVVSSVPEAVWVEMVNIHAGPGPAEQVFIRRGVPHEERAHATHAVEAFRMVVLQQACLPPVLAGMMLWAFLTLLRNLPYSTWNLMRLQADMHVPALRAAASGGKFLKVFRGVGAAAGLCSLAMIGLAGWSLVVLLRDVAGAGGGGAPRGTSVAYAWLLLWGAPAEHVGRCAWLTLLAAWPALVIILTVLVSLGHRMMTRHRLRSDVHRLARQSSPALERVRRLGPDLADRAGIPPPGIVVVGTGQAYAAADEFGLFRRDRFIYLDQCCLDALDEAELHALLAHEYVHLMRGHCRVHNLLQYLGRLTLLGGGFMGGVENSYGYEAEADRLAIRALGADPMALQSALARMRAVNAFAQAVEGVSVVGLKVVPAMDRAAQLMVHAGPQRGWPRLRDRLKLFLMLYLSDGGISYWHPLVTERIANLEQAEASAHASLAVDRG